MTRLLTKAEVKEASAKAREADFKRSVAVHEFVVAEEKELNAWKVRKEKEIERIQSSLIEAENEYASVTAGLKQEVASLEARKKEALKPLTEIRKGLDEREKELQQKADIIEKDREELREERETVASWKADLADQAEKFKEWVETLSVREKGLKKQEDYISVTHQAFNKHVFEKKQAIELEETRLKSVKGDLEAREALLVKDKEWIRQERDEIAKEKRLVASERAAVQSAYDQLKKKG